MKHRLDSEDLTVLAYRFSGDAFCRAERFAAYAQGWLEIIPRCGGELVGSFLSHEGTNYEAFGLVGFESLAVYEAYRAQLGADDAAANFAFARDHGFIRSERRSFLTPMKRREAA